MFFSISHQVFVFEGMDFPGVFVVKFFYRGDAPEPHLYQGLDGGVFVVGEAVFPGVDCCDGVSDDVEELGGGIVFQDLFQEIGVVGGFFHPADGAGNFINRIVIIISGFQLFIDEMVGDTFEEGFDL